MNTLVEDGKTQALFLFCKRRQPFSELDVKCLSMVCSFFHPKVHMPGSNRSFGISSKPSSSRKSCCVRASGWRPWAG